MKATKKIFCLVFILAGLFLLLNSWNDEDLFTTITRTGAKPNVVFLQDCSGSMSEGVYHPDYDPNTLTTYSAASAFFTKIQDKLTKTIWHERWVNTSNRRIYSPPYAIINQPVTVQTQIIVDGNGSYIDVGDYVIAKKDGNGIAASAQVTGKSGSNPYTLTLDNATRIGTFVRNYYVATAARIEAVAGNIVTVNAAGSYINVGDYILAGISNAIGKVTDKQLISPNYQLTLDNTLDSNIFKPNVFTVGDFVFITKYTIANRSSRVVKLYGTSIKQNNVWYDQDGANYLEWLYSDANDAQRNQVSMFSALGAHLEQRCYTDRVSPETATNPDNASETLLEEWNRVWPSVFPTKIANLGANITATATTLNYTDAKATFQGYGSNFYIKIDSETMLVSTNSTGGTAESGTLTVTRAERNTRAASHASGVSILIYNQEAPANPVIREYTPISTLFSSAQHVNEPTGELDTAWTENIDPDGGGSLPTANYYRYKRVFSRIQVAREALSDVATAKNKLLKVAELETSIDDDDPTLTYLNGTPSFLTMDPSVATFYIKVTNPEDPDNNEFMKVTAHNSGTHKLTVTRAQLGTTAHAHTRGAAIQTFSGIRDEVIIGLFTFAPPTMRQSLKDFGKKNADGTYKPVSYINAYLDTIWNNINASGNTPIAIALAEVWRYFKPSDNTNSPDYRTGENYNVVNSSTFGLNDKFEQLDKGDGLKWYPKGSPCQFWCQNNYVVVITDGQANGDTGLKSTTNYGVFGKAIKRSTTPIPGEYCRWDYNNGWGDLDSNDVGTYYNLQGTATRTYCPGETCWLKNAGSDMLDDVAYFMYHQDMFPTRKVNSSGELVTDTTLYNESDTEARKVWKGDQRVSTYTVGLTIRNDLLAETAANGHGLNFTASNYQELGESFIAILENIAFREEPMMYTTYAAPKQSVTSGNYGYVAHFIPSSRSMWEGHLRRFLLGDDGNFPENIDLLTATNRGAVTVNGVPNQPSYQWDVQDSLKTRTVARTVYTVKAGIRANFNDNSAITRTDLGVDTDAKRDTLKAFITNFNATYSYKYGDTFHFNPLLVGYPLKWKGTFDKSYQSFYNRYSTGAFKRDEVVYVGANDGKLHCYLANANEALNLPGGYELWGFIPPSLLKKLAGPALSPDNSNNHDYFVDGKALVKDIKVSSLGDYRDWKTVIFFGMGIGGKSYCALDVTDPMDPKFLWEFSDAYSATNTGGRQGYSEAKPVVVDIHNGASTFPAVILAGGYDMLEVAADSTDAGLQDYQKLEGKALYILDARDGSLVKKFAYGSASNSATLNLNPGFKYAMTAAPAVLDKNNDGIADYIYMAETGDYHVAAAQGGRIWKINCLGDPAGWAAQKIYQAADGQTFFVSPTLGYDSDYRVWVMAGTGRRSNPTAGLSGLFTNLSGQFISFLDTASATLPITNSSLTNITSAINNDANPNATYEMVDTDGNTVSYGFYANFMKASNEILFEPQPLFLGNRIYFMTFAPEGAGGTATPDDPCSGDSASGGQHYIYDIGFKATGSSIKIANSTATSGKILGYGALSGTKYKLYIGQGNVGGFVSLATPPIELENVFGPMLWKEEKR